MIDLCGTRLLLNLPNLTIGVPVNKTEPIKLHLIAEFEGSSTVEDARRRPDAFRESALPSQNYGITLYENPDHDTIRLSPTV